MISLGRNGLRSIISISLSKPVGSCPDEVGIVPGTRASEALET